MGGRTIQNWQPTDQLLPNATFLFNLILEKKTTPKPKQKTQRNPNPPSYPHTLLLSFPPVPMLCTLCSTHSTLLSSFYSLSLFNTPSSFPSRDALVKKGKQPHISSRALPALRPSPLYPLLSSQRMASTDWEGLARQNHINPLKLRRTLYANKRYYHGPTAHLKSVMGKAE